MTRRTDYTDLEAVRAEVREARRIFAEHHWPVIDVTRRSIEETAAAILKLLGAAPWPRRHERGSILASASTARARAAALQPGVDFAVEPAAIDEAALKRQFRAGGSQRRRLRAGAGRGQGTMRCRAATAGAGDRRRSDPGLRRRNGSTSPRDLAAARHQLRSAARPRPRARDGRLRGCGRRAVVAPPRAAPQLDDAAHSATLSRRLSCRRRGGGARLGRRLSARGARRAAVRSRSTATISRSSACRCCRCSAFCASKAGSR